MTGIGERKDENCSKPIHHRHQRLSISKNSFRRVLKNNFSFLHLRVSDRFETLSLVQLETVDLLLFVPLENKRKTHKIMCFLINKIIKISLNI